GMLAAGTRGRTIVAVNGTSVSAPQVTRWIAAEMTAGRAGNRAAVAAEGGTHPTLPRIPLKRGNLGYVDSGYYRTKIDRHAPLESRHGLGEVAGGAGRPSRSWDEPRRLSGRDAPGGSAADPRADDAAHGLDLGLGHLVGAVDRVGREQEDALDTGFL